MFSKQTNASIHIIGMGIPVDTIKSSAHLELSGKINPAIPLATVNLDIIKIQRVCVSQCPNNVSHQRTGVIIDAKLEGIIVPRALIIAIIHAKMLFLAKMAMSGIQYI